VYPFFAQHDYSPGPSPGTLSPGATAGAHPPPPHPHPPPHAFAAPGTSSAPAFAAPAPPEHHVDQIQDDPPLDEEPLYVNAKQYYRILKRRAARQRMDEVHRLSKQRKVRHTLAPPVLPAPTCCSSSRTCMSRDISMRCAAPAGPAAAS
jgi:hypothetical protein